MSVLLFIGGVIFVVAFFGCCGAWRENRCLIYTYGAILVIILISQVSVHSFYHSLRIVDIPRRWLLALLLSS